MKKSMLITGLAFAMSGVMYLTAYAGWQQNGATWSYEENGRRLTGWNKIDKSWYYFDDNGNMVTGWLQDNDRLYYLLDDGSMVVNQWVNDYYAGPDGVMMKNTWVNDSYVGNDGRRVPGASREYLNYSNRVYGNRVVRSFFADVTHDGLVEYLVVVGPEQSGGESLLAVHTIKDNQVRRICERSCNKRSAYYLYEQDGKIYIVGTISGIYQGRGRYSYDVFSLTADGVQNIIDFDSFEVLEPTDLDRQYARFYEKIRPYVENGRVLFDEV